MTYHCGIGPGMAQLGFEPCEPHLVCDDCGLRLTIDRSRIAPAWLLNDTAPRGWLCVHSEVDGAHTRTDYCPRCKDKHVEKKPVTIQVGKTYKILPGLRWSGKLKVIALDADGYVVGWDAQDKNGTYIYDRAVLTGKQFQEWTGIEP